MNPKFPLHRRTFLGRVALAAFLPGAPASAQTTAAKQSGHAPFGLTWGMGFGDVRGLCAVDEWGDGQNSVGKDSNTNRFFNLPGAIKGTRFVDLSFGNRDSLYKVVAIGDWMKGTLWDGEAYARYSQLAALLTENYGPGTEEVPSSWNPFSKSSKRTMVFRTDEMTVVLALTTDTDAGPTDPYWYLVFWNEAGAAAAVGDSHNSEKAKL